MIESSLFASVGRVELYKNLNISGQLINFFHPLSKADGMTLYSLYFCDYNRLSKLSANSWYSDTCLE